MVFIDPADTHTVLCDINIAVLNLNSAKYLKYDVYWKLFNWKVIEHALHMPWPNTLYCYTLLAEVYTFKTPWP